MTAIQIKEDVWIYVMKRDDSQPVIWFIIMVNDDSLSHVCYSIIIRDSCQSVIWFSVIKSQPVMCMSKLSNMVTCSVMTVSPPVAFLNVGWGPLLS